MLQNISKPTFFGNDHVLNSKILEQNFKHCKFYISVYSSTGYQKYLHKSEVHTSVPTAFLSKKHRKSTHKTITQFLCLIFKNIMIG